MTKILVIDHVKDDLLSLSTLIENLIPECSSISTQSGEEGIKKALEELPDTILLNIEMAGMDGFKVCKRLKSDEKTMYIPIIMLTAIITDTQTRIRGLEIGANAFLSKPVDEAELVAQVNAMLRIKRAEDILRKEKDLLNNLIKEINRELEETEERYQLLFDAGNDAVFVYHIERDGKLGKYIEANDVACRRLGYSKEELLKLSPFEICDPESQYVIPTQIEKLFEEKHVLFERSIITKNGEKIPVEINAQLFELNGRTTVLSIARDITIRKQAEEDLRRSNRALQMMSGVNQAMVHAADEVRLLNDVCCGIVEKGGYQLVWVGFAEQDKNKTMKPVAHVGFEKGYFK